MANSNGYITEPVRQIADIKTVLQANVNDLGGLITSGLVNMWSKVKPVRYNSRVKIDDAKRASVKYGLSWSTYSTPAALINAAASLGQGNLAWSYLLPRGESYNEHFRRLDFSTYQHRAVCPMILGPASSTVYAVDPHPAIVDNSPIQPANGNLQISDLSLGNMGLAYRNGSSGTASTIDNVAQGTNIPFSGSGTWQYALYFKPSSVYIPAPYPYFTLTVAATYGVQCSTKNVEYTTTLDFSVMVQNIGRSRTLKIVSAHRRKQGNYSLNADGFTYNITATASAVATDYEADVTINDTNTYADSSSWVVLGDGTIEYIYHLNCNPYQNNGDFFIRVQYTYPVGSGTNTKDVYLQLGMVLPVNPNQ